MMTPEDYLKERVANQMRYFSKAAESNKKYFYAISILKLTLMIIVTVISPVICGYTVYSCAVSGLSGCVSLLEGILLIYRFYDNWILYRITNEKLKREEILYLTSAAEYSDCNERFRLFVQNVENIIDNSNRKWEKTHNKLKGVSNA